MLLFHLSMVALLTAGTHGATATIRQCDANGQVTGTENTITVPDTCDDMTGAELELVCAQYNEQNVLVQMTPATSSLVFMPGQSCDGQAWGGINILGFEAGSGPAICNVPFDANSWTVQSLDCSGQLNLNDLLHTHLLLNNILHPAGANCEGDREKRCYTDSSSDVTTALLTASYGLTVADNSCTCKNSAHLTHYANPNPQDVACVGDATDDVDMLMNLARGQYIVKETWSCPDPSTHTVTDYIPVDTCFYLPPEQNTQNLQGYAKYTADATGISMLVFAATDWECSGTTSATVEVSSQDVCIQNENSRIQYRFEDRTDGVQCSAVPGPDAGGQSTSGSGTLTLTTCDSQQTTSEVTSAMSCAEMVPQQGSGWNGNHFICAKFGDPERNVVAEVQIWDQQDECDPLKWQFVTIHELGDCDHPVSTSHGSSGSLGGCAGEPPFDLNAMFSSYMLTPPQSMSMQEYSTMTEDDLNLLRPVGPQCNNNEEKRCYGSTLVSLHGWGGVFTNSENVECYCKNQATLTHYALAVGPSDLCVNGDGSLENVLTSLARGEYIIERRCFASNYYEDTYTLPGLCSWDMNSGNNMFKKYTIIDETRMSVSTFETYACNGTATETTEISFSQQSNGCANDQYSYTQNNREFYLLNHTTGPECEQRQVFTGNHTSQNHSSRSFQGFIAQDAQLDGECRNDTRLYCGTTTSGVHRPWQVIYTQGTNCASNNAVWIERTAINRTCNDSETTLTLENMNTVATGEFVVSLPATTAVTTLCPSITHIQNLTESQLQTMVKSQFECADMTSTSMHNSQSSSETYAANTITKNSTGDFVAFKTFTSKQACEDHDPESTSGEPNYHEMQAKLGCDEQHQMGPGQQQLMILLNVNPPESDGGSTTAKPDDEDSSSILDGEGFLGVTGSQVGDIGLIAGVAVAVIAIAVATMFFMRKGKVPQRVGTYDVDSDEYDDLSALKGRK